MRSKASDAHHHLGKDILCSALSEGSCTVVADRIVFAAGGHGGEGLVAKKIKKGWFSSSNKTAALPLPPTLNIAQTRAVPKPVGRVVVPKKQTRYSWWDKVQSYATNTSDPQNFKKGQELIRAVKKVLSEVVHSVATKPYVPPQATSESGVVKRPKFDLVTRAELKLICLTAQRVLLKHDETLVDVAAPCKVFGDIHGQMTDLVQFFRQYGAPSHRCGDINLCTYIFSGDFVDRGAYSLEVLTTLLCLKVRYHTHVVLLRGNHEDKFCNQNYGFIQELKDRFGPTEGMGIYEEHILPVFQSLPLAALIEKKIFICHGGPGLHVETLDDIRSIQRPVLKLTHKMSVDDPKHNMVVDLLWSDPTEGATKGLTKKDCQFDHESGMWYGRGFNNGRGVSTLYGPDVLEKFCRINKIDLVIRAHECVEEGMLQQQKPGTTKTNLITLFSAPKYGKGGTNNGCILDISRELHIQAKALTASDSSRDQGYDNGMNLDKPRR